ncbi:MAG: TadG family pilus assembly protein [Sphingomonas sp.]
MISRLARARRGGVGIMVAAAMPILLGATALAVDLGSAMLETRQLQGAADAAAMAAAGDPSRADALARASLATSRWPGAVAVTTTTGHYSGDASIAPADRFVPGSGSANAVRVTLRTPAPSYFARIFGIRSIPLARSATAAQINLASFSLGSRLAAVNGGLVNGLLGGLTGSNLSLSVMDYNALAGANIDLFDFIDALRTTASLRAGSYDNALDASVTTGQILQAAASVAQANGDLAAAAALRLLTAQSPDRSIKLGALIDPGLLGGQDKVDPGAFKLNVMDLVTAALETATPTRQVSLDMGAGIPGLAQTKLTVAIGERPNHSPWLAVTDNGEPVIRTAQARIYAETTIGGASLLGTIVSIKLPLYVEMASAEARLKAIDCSTDASRGVTIEAKTGPSTIAIGSVDTSRLQDFTSELAVNKVSLVHALLLNVNGRARIDLGAAESWQPVSFDATEIANASVQTVSSGSAVAGIAESLIRNLQLDVSGLALGPIVSALGSTLMLVAPVLDGVIDTVTNTLGVHYGQADVRVTGLRCGTPALVA